MHEPQRASRREPDVRLRFSRYECKYLLSEDQAEFVRQFVEPYVERDHFAARQENGRYSISSLYLDNEKFRLANETTDGLRNRFKLRIRAYTDAPEDPVFLEVKQRRDRRIGKERCRMRRADVARLLDGEPVDPPAEASERKHFQSFLAKMHQVNARPRLLVRYEREALRGRFDDDVRVTFDRQLIGLPVDQVGPYFDLPGWNLIEGKKVILELKFNGHFPRWMTDVTRVAGLERTSYSKYANTAFLSFPRAALRKFAN